MATTSKADVEKAVQSGTEEDAVKDKTVAGDEKAVEAARSAELEAQLRAAEAEKAELLDQLAALAERRVRDAAPERERRSVKNPGTVVRSFDADGHRVEAT
jgi:hypothetical protein